MMSTRQLILSTVMFVNVVHQQHQGSYNTNHSNNYIFCESSFVPVSYKRTRSSTTGTRSSSTTCIAFVEMSSSWISPTALHRIQQREYNNNNNIATTTTTTTTTTCSTGGSVTSSARYLARSVDDPDYDVPKYPKPRQDAAEQAATLLVSGGQRPGAIIESEEQLEIKNKIMNEIEIGTRDYSEETMSQYGVLIDDEEAEYIYEGGVDPESALDAEALGTWTIQDIRSTFPYEWDPNSGIPDPNLVEMNLPGKKYVETNPIDPETNIEIGYDPIFGPSNPIDTRTILGVVDSYMIDETTRDEAMLTPQFHPNDIEIRYNEDIVKFRKSLNIMETYQDLFLSNSAYTTDDKPAEAILPIPRHVAKWHGYPEQTFLEPKNFTNNRFTADEDRTDFDSMTPYDARRRAVELARSKNAEWLPDGISQAYHISERASYEKYNTLIGTLRKGYCNPEIVDIIRPALQVLGSCCELLSTNEITASSSSLLSSNDDASQQQKQQQKSTMSTATSSSSSSLVLRFAYHGLMKNKHGMKCWTEQMIREECGLTQLTGVVFETGFRKRDQPYDGGDKWYGPY